MSIEVGRMKPEGTLKQALYAIHERSQRRISDEDLVVALSDNTLPDREFTWIYNLVPSFWSGKAAQTLATRLSEIGDLRNASK